MKFKKCILCGRRFKPNSNYHKFCGEKCIKKNRRIKYLLHPRRKIIKCILCGENLIGTNNIKYCKKCRKKGIILLREKGRELANKKAKEWYKKNRKKLFRERDCWICGQSLKGSNRRRFCKKCSRQNKEIRLKIKNELRNKRLYLLKMLGGKCAFCNSTINPQIHHTKRENLIENLILLCRKCHFRMEHNNMEKSMPIFNGMLKEEIKKHIFCEECGSRRFVVLHHIDENRKNNHVSNLKFLCRKCYRRIHNFSQSRKKNLK